MSNQLDELITSSLAAKLRGSSNQSANREDPEAQNSQDHQHDSNPPEQKKMTKPISKVQRVRDYFKKNPAARNRDVVAALTEFGVSSADVANAKSALKKKKTKRGSTKSASQSKQAQSKPRSAKSRVSIDARIEVDLLDLGVEFVKKAGGMNEAQHILNLISRIRSL